MPLLTITILGSELEKRTFLLLERPYDFTELKLQHIYHNIDSINFTAKNDRSEQTQLFIRLGGLNDNSKNITNYVGTYETMKTSQVARTYTDDDFQRGQTFLRTDTDDNADRQTAAASATRVGGSFEINHLIPIGATRHNSAELISRDMFKSLHEGGVLNFSGELDFQLFYLNSAGSITPVTTTTGPIKLFSGRSDFHKSFVTLVFEYKEL